MTDISITNLAGIQRIQLNRPQKKNALTPPMYDAMRDALKSATADPDIRVVFITGSGDSFCAGNDLASFLAEPDSPAAGDFISAIVDSQLPVVAAVNGVAVGVGATMLLHCDLVYAADTASLRFPFVDLGIAPEAASTYLLPRMLGYSRAAELLLLGEPVTARRAYELGIVNQVTTADALDELAWSKTKMLAAKPPEALKQARMLLRRGMLATMRETMALEMQVIGERLASDEARQIMAAFFARR